MGTRVPDIDWGKQQQQQLLISWSRRLVQSKNKKISVVLRALCYVKDYAADPWTADEPLG